MVYPEKIGSLECPPHFESHAPFVEGNEQARLPKGCKQGYVLVMSAMNITLRPANVAGCHCEYVCDCWLYLCGNDEHGRNVLVVFCVGRPCAQFGVQGGRVGWGVGLSQSGSISAHQSQPLQISPWASLKGPEKRWASLSFSLKPRKKWHPIHVETSPRRPPQAAVQLGYSPEEAALTAGGPWPDRKEGVGRRTLFCLGCIVFF